MLPNNVIDAKVEGNLNGETVKMEIDATATKHLMSVLTDLYSDRIMAFIREYATNAWDAHIEAGVSRPIEVTLPSRMTSYYRIKDYGVGLDVSDIRDIYSKYGKSTKRGSNDYNGMLGLGCKSAMTYAAQFSIISVKDGVKYSVSVSRGSDGVGEMQVVDTTKTTEPNGVEIVIPVKTNDIWAVAEKVNSFFQWWPAGSVLVNGRPPRRFEGREIAPGLFMVDGLDGDLVVMGNVAYPVPYEEGIYQGEKDNFGYSRKTFSVVYFAGMGDVTFSPSRESLQTTLNTKNTVDKARKLFIDNLIKSLQTEIDAKPTHREALSHVRHLAKRYRDIDFSVFTYKGLAIPTEGWEANFTLVDGPKDFYGKSKKQKKYDYFHWYDADGGSPEEKITTLSIEKVERYASSMVFIVNAPKEITGHQKTKMRRAYKAGDLKSVYLFLVPGPTKPGGVWTDGIPTQDWSVIRDFKLNSGTAVSDRTKHEVYDAAGAVTNRAVPDAEKIVYVSPTFFKDTGYYGPSLSLYVQYFNKAGYSFVQLNANRHAKFQREHKNSMHLDKAVQFLVSEYEKNLSADDRALLSLNSDDVKRLAALGNAGVDIADPVMLQWSKKVTDKTYDAVKALRTYHESRTRHTSARMKEIPEVTLFDEYPLVKCLSSHEVMAHAKHVSHYIEVVYNSKKEEKK